MAIYALVLKKMSGWMVLFIKAGCGGCRFNCIWTEILRKTKVQVEKRGVGILSEVLM